MKKILFISLAAVAALASCSNDETVEMARGNAIGFESFVDKSTLSRVTPDADITLNNLGSIEVYGWRGNDQIFNKQEVTVGSSGTGTYTPVQYWEAGYTYAFEAIHPKNETRGITFVPAQTGGKITFVNNKMTDLLYDKADDVTTPVTIDTKPAPVSFTFKHLLSRVKFTFVNGFPEDAVAKISVLNVEISDACQKGEITPAATNAAWTSLENNLDIVFPSANVADIPAGNQSGETEHMYLIPLAQASYTVTFTVTLNQNGAMTNYSHEVTITDGGMIPGNSYNFVATLTPENINPDTSMYPIEFTAKVSPWEDFNNPGTEILPEEEVQP